MNFRVEFNNLSKMHRPIKGNLYIYVSILYIERNKFQNFAQKKEKIPESQHQQQFKSLGKLDIGPGMVLGYFIFRFKS